MYSRRRSGNSLFTLILLGMFAGVIVLAFNSLNNRDTGRDNPVIVEALPTASLTPTSEAAQISADVTSIPASVSTVSDIYAPIVDANLVIPAAGIYRPIVQTYLDGTSWDVSGLGMNVGHLQGTNWVTEGGNVVLSGHVEMRDGKAGVFARIDDLEIGDLVILRQGGVDYEFSVSNIRTVEPDDLTPLYPSTTNMITLITCDEYNFFQNVYTKRVVVVAERLG